MCARYLKVIQWCYLNISYVLKLACTTVSLSSLLTVQ